MRRSGSARGVVMPVASTARPAYGRRPPGSLASPPERGGAGTSRSRWGCPRSIRHLGQAQLQVVMEHEHGSLLQGESAEGAFQLVAVVDGQRPLRGRAWPPSAAPGSQPYGAAAAGPRRSTCWSGSDGARARTGPGSRSVRISRQAVMSAACTASAARSASRRIRCAMAMHRSPTRRARASKASLSPRFACSTSARCTRLPSYPRRADLARHNRERLGLVGGSIFEPGRAAARTWQAPGPGRACHAGSHDRPHHLTGGETHVPTINRPHHMGIQVADLERSLGFYRDILGFELVFQWNPQARVHPDHDGLPGRGHPRRRPADARRQRGVPGDPGVPQRGEDARRYPNGQSRHGPHRILHRRLRRACTPSSWPRGWTP